MRIGVEIDFDPEKILRNHGLNPGGEVEQAVANAVIEYSKPYWAYDTGRLANSGVYADGQVVYDVSYAQDMYYGVRDDGTPVNYHLEKNPLAGPFPFERMKADHMTDILEEAKRVAGGK